jgi:hypothetical protein
VPAGRHVVVAVVLDLEQVAMGEQELEPVGVALDPAMGDEDRGGNRVRDQHVGDAPVEGAGTGVEGERHLRPGLRGGGGEAQGRLHQPLRPGGLRVRRLRRKARREREDAC